MRGFVRFILLVAVITFLALPVLTYPLGRDQGEFAVLAQGLIDGRRPYVDLWNPNPPGVLYVFSWAIRCFGTSLIAIRVLDLIMFPILGGALYWLGKWFTSRRAGVLAMLGAAMFYFTEGFWTLTQKDGFSLVPMTLAVVCAAKTLDARRYHWLWAFLAGAFSVTAAWFKYPLLIVMAALALGHLISRLSDPTRPRRAVYRRLLKEAFAYSAGGLLVGLGALYYFHTIGILGALVESAKLTSHYTSLGYTPRNFLDSPAWRGGVNERWYHWKPLLLLAALWPVLRVVRFRKTVSRKPSEDLTSQPSLHTARRDSSIQDYRSEPSQHGELYQMVARWPTIWLWGLAGVAVVVIQAKGYAYHWLPILPPLVLIAADSVEQLLEASQHLLIRRLNGRRAAHSLATIASLLIMLWMLNQMFLSLWRPTLPYLTGSLTESEYLHRFQGGEFIASESVAVANYLKANTKPGDTLYIWGFRPEVYYLSGLRPATRFIYQFPLVGDWYPQAWKAQNVQTLWSAPPAFVLVVRADYMPWTTGRNEDSHTLLQEYVDLNNWLMYNYERQDDIGFFLVWKRKLIPG